MALQIAAPPEKKIKPAFVVEKLPGKAKRKFIKLTTEDGVTTREEYTKDVDAGYMVTLMKGHSVHIWTKKDLERLELDKTIPLVNDEGDTVGSLPNTINKIP